MVQVQGTKRQYEKRRSCKGGTESRHEEAVVALVNAMIADREEDHDTLLGNVSGGHVVVEGVDQSALAVMAMVSVVSVVSVVCAGCWPGRISVADEWLPGKVSTRNLTPKVRKLAAGLT